MNWIFFISRCFKIALPVGFYLGLSGAALCGSTLMDQYGGDGPPKNNVGANACSSALEENGKVEPERSPIEDNKYIVEHAGEGKFVTNGKLVPCTASDLLRLGFQLKAKVRYGPDTSTNGAFEEVSTYQNGSTVVSCYFEFELNRRGRDSEVAWSRLACGQTVPIRVRPSVQR